MGRLRSFFGLKQRDRMLLLEALLLLAAARVLVHTVRFERLAARLGDHMGETAAEQDGEANAVARRVRWAVKVATRNAPFEAICLPQAIAAKLMLSRRHIPSTLYLGVARDAELKAHAWLRVGRITVTGEEGRRAFSVISTFA